MAFEYFGVSALCFMFFHWFGVKLTNTSNLLFAIQGGGPGKNAWETLNYIPIVLVIAIVATLTIAALRLANAFPRRYVRINAVIASLGLVTMVLIFLRIVDPPIFYTEATITSEGTVQLPIFLALLAAAGITLGGCLATWEEGFSFPSLRPSRQQDRASLDI